LDDLNQCDFLISSFPFGNTNGNVDAFILGKPVIAMYGEEICSYTDVSFVTSFGLPEWLIPRSKQELVESALRMISSDEDRQAISKQILEQDPQRKFFAIEEGAEKGASAGMFQWLIKNHSKIKQSSEREFFYEPTES
jgi:predicted O-linked N-acetylglucosamine transferase (SPINDLY family)